MKGQVSVFAILGIIVLFSVGLFFYYQGLAITPDVQQQKLSPVERFVSACMQEALDEAVNLAGQQGGFITVPPSISVDPGRYVSPDGQDIVRVPLWFYRGLRYSPSRESVAHEIEAYTLVRAKECIGDFRAFSDATITPRGEMRMAAALNKEDVTLTLVYPVDVDDGSERTRLERFQASSRVRLGPMLDTANAILESELSTAILENFTLDLMSSNPDVPFTGMLFECGQKEWRLTELRAKVREMLEVNLPRIRIKDTNYPPFIAPEAQYKKLEKLTMKDIAEGRIPEAPDDSYEYLRMFWNMNVQKDADLHVGFTLPRPIDLLATPQENGVLRSQPAQGDSQYLPLLCINIYHFLYNINYPALVTLRDDRSYGGKGFLFRFAMPVTIRDNEPYKLNYGATLFSSPVVDETFCSQRNDIITEIRVLGKRDGVNNLELPGANLTMECYRYQCPLGQTMADEGSYRLRVNLPESCSNPYIIAEKEGYLKAKVQLTNPESLTIPVKQIRELPFEVVVHRYSGSVDQLSTVLEEGMAASVSLSTEGLSQYKLDTASDAPTIKLIDDDVSYQLEITLVQGEEVVGGYRGTWNPQNVGQAGRITFHALKFVPLNDKDAKRKMMQVLAGSSYQKDLAPELG